MPKVSKDGEESHELLFFSGSLTLSHHLFGKVVYSTCDYEFGSSHQAKYLLIYGLVLSLSLWWPHGMHGILVSLYSCLDVRVCGPIILSWYVLSIIRNISLFLVLFPCWWFLLMYVHVSKCHVNIRVIIFLTYIFIM